MKSTIGETTLTLYTNANLWLGVRGWGKGVKGTIGETTLTLYTNANLWSKHYALDMFRPKVSTFVKV